MTRKFALAALAVAALAAGPIFTTQAEAKNGRQGAGIALGVAAGIGGLIIGSAIANARSPGYGETRYHAEPRHRGHGYGFRTVNAYAVDEEDCFQKPIRRFDPYSGRVVVVGSKVVCR
ncbi:MAG: hypothetical protein ACRDBL_01545 [Rhabdaerophilum sp.]